MKKIIINGNEYYYRIIHGEYSTFTILFILDGTHKKFNFFGRRFGSLVNKYNEAFIIRQDIEDPHNSKEKLKEDLEREESWYIKARDRLKEIEQGNII